MNNLDLIKLKEIAIITAYIQSNDLLNGSFFQTIDKAFDLACNFYEEYKNYLPNWTINNLEFDEAIEKFVLGGL